MKFNALSLDMKRLVAEKAFLLEYITKIYPSGFVSYVSDSFDYYGLLTKVAPSIKEQIMAREGRLVFRPDSGDPVQVVAGYRVVEVENRQKLQTAAFYNWYEDCFDSYDAIHIIDENLYFSTPTPYFSWDEIVVIPEHEAKGSVEVLWEIFGGEVNSKGYKVLDTHVGLIYGDSITLERATEIFARLKAKGFASSNIVFGIGSYTYNFSTRDTFGFACKATGSIIDGEEILVSKEPKTDVKKKSAKGFLSVVKDPDGDYRLVDGLSFEDIKSEENELAVVFRDGQLIRKQTLDEVRKNVQEELNKHI